MSARTSIHPSIEAAMGSLDLTLESELTLFRNRYASAGAIGNSAPAESAPSAQTPFALSGTAPDVPFAHHDDETILDVPNREVQAADDLAEEAARLLDVSLEDMAVEDAQQSTDVEQVSQEGSSEPLSPDEDIPSGAIVPSNALLPSEGALADSATLKTYTDPSLDDYLESSEALLRHLDTPVPSNQFDNSVSFKWFAWAAGATLALSLLAAFFLQNVFQAPDESVPEQESVSTETPAPADPSPGINSPDLASKEFQQVKPGSLAELPTPVPQTPSRDSEVPSSAEGTSESSTVPSTPTADTTEDAGADDPVSPSERRYYVVTDVVKEDGEEASLATVKAIAPEAKLVNFSPAGRKIQLQEFADETAARTAAAEFEQKGITVEILATAAE